ncbi:MAG: Zn-ribbon domain-containing OB-fold protein [Solirubrobacteraceae bacterium]
MTAPAIELPEAGPLMQEQRAALEEGRLTHQRCLLCGYAWLPPGGECPSCLGAEWTWETAAGGGRIVSWVVYHRAYHPAFADRVPYNVAIVELDEGPRLVTNVIGVEGGEGLEIERPVRLHVEHEGGVPVARFRLM